MNKISQGLVLAAAVLALSACAERWEKPGASEMEFEATKATCSTHAASRFPPLLREIQISDAYVTPVTTSCTDTPHNVTCTTRGGQFVPARMGVVDDNEDARDQAVRACFFQNGWHPARD